jgi:AraC-like DNA-binding protein
MVRYYLLLDADEQMQELSSVRIAIFPLYYSLSLMIGLGVQFAYFLSAYLWAKKEKLKEYSSDLQRNSRLFIYQLASLKLFLMALWIIIYLIMPIDEARLLAIPIYGFMVFVFLYYKLFQYSDFDVFTAFIPVKEDKQDAEMMNHILGKETNTRSGITKIGESTTDDEGVESVFQLVQKCMVEDKLYRNQGLSLQQLADEVGVDIHTLSMCINRRAKVNFFNFVNRYRIEESLLLLKSDNQGDTSIEDIAFQVGFNSRTAFYSSFKRQIGKTPTQFQEEELISN